MHGTSLSAFGCKHYQLMTPTDAHLDLSIESAGVVDVLICCIPGDWHHGM
jgi:hypothetical protein